MEENLTISPEQFEIILEAARKWRGYDDYAAYRKEDEDELFFYYHIKPSVSNINVDLYADDGEHYKKNNHPLWIYMRGKYSGLIPVSVCDYP